MWIVAQEEEGDNEDKVMDVCIRIIQLQKIEEIATIISAVVVVIGAAEGCSRNQLVYPNLLAIPLL